MRRGVGSGFAAGRFCGLELEAQQVLDQVTLFTVGEAQAHTGVVVIDDGTQISETTIVIEAAFKVGRDRADRRRTITQIGSAIGLKVVDADVAGLVKIPAGLGP